MIPKMKETLNCNPAKPVYGVLLEEHLRVTNRDIAQVLEACICFLLETGLDEEVKVPQGLDRGEWWLSGRVLDYFREGFIFQIKTSLNWQNRSVVY